MFLMDLFLVEPVAGRGMEKEREREREREREKIKNTNSYTVNIINIIFIVHCMPSALVD